MENEEKNEQSDKSIDSDNLENKQNYEYESPRGSLPKKGFLDNLAQKAEEIKRQSIELGKIAAREAGDLGEKIDDVVDEKWDAAKKFKPKSFESKSEIIDLLERLAKLKEQGVITEKEFNAKKKDLLNKI